jgi:hypothetical protein
VDIGPIVDKLFNRFDPSNICHHVKTSPVPRKFLAIIRMP